MVTATGTAYEQILFEQQGRVAVITLNRPEKLNAWTWQPHDHLMKEALALAGEIAANPTDAATAAKEILHRNMVEQDLEAVVRREGEVISRQYQSAGHKEAIRAFIEKREPQFNQ